VPRDIYAYLFTSFSILSSILDQFGREIRNLQRSGIEEVMEPFTEKQVGSSVMPHKRNPILSEKICGLSKVIRGLCMGWLENIVIEHERDLTNSSFERIAVPEAFILLDEQIRTAKYVIDGLVVNRDNMLKNIEREGDWIYSDILVQMIALKGGDRQKAHEQIRKIAISGANINEMLNDRYLASYIAETDLDTEQLLRRCVQAASDKTMSFLTKIAEKYGLSLTN
jgi:adenylosuccinate lyase